MKLADSLNPATQADNIKKLNAGLEAVDAKTLPGTSTATTGQILKLTGENKIPGWTDEYSYTPPAYSETEVNTGKKWIDGKDIYCKVVTGNCGIQTGAFSIDLLTENFDGNVISIEGYASKESNFSVYIGKMFSTTYYIGARQSANKSIAIYFSNSIFSEYDYNVIVYYTKPDPAPETRDDDTPEEVKENKTRKKTTK